MKNKTIYLKAGAISLFALIAVFGVSIFTQNSSDSNIEKSKASAQEPADINSDNKVDIFDLSILLANWSKTGSSTSDLNSDSVINIFDLSLLLSKWGAVATGGSCAANEVGTPPNCYTAPPAPLASGKQWKMLFNDEFDGTSLNLSNFTPCFDWNYGGCTNTFNNGREHYDPAQVQVSGGTAKLIAEPLVPAAGSGCYGGACTYKAGLISTARPRADNGSAYLHPFTYGYVESRMKYSSVSGFFTAFWMLPTDSTYNYRSEIDIVEILGGDPDTIFMSYHYNNRSQSHAVNVGDHNNGACQVKDYSTDYVTFGLDWQPDHVAWYINGVKCGQFTGDSTTVENGPMQIILHMMVDNDWERSWGLTLANLGLISQLEVDYLRVYQQQ